MTDRRFFQIEVSYSVAILFILVSIWVILFAVHSEIEDLKQQMQTPCVEQSK